MKMWWDSNQGNISIYSLEAIWGLREETRLCWRTAPYLRRKKWLCTGADSGSIKTLKWQLKVSILWRCDKGRQRFLAETWKGGRDPTEIPAVLRGSSDTIRRKNETIYHTHKVINNNINNNSKVRYPIWGNFSSNICSQNKHLIIVFSSCIVKSICWEEQEYFSFNCFFLWFCTVLICHLVFVWIMKRCNNKKLWMSSWENIRSESEILTRSSLPSTLLSGRLLPLMSNYHDVHFLHPLS